MDSVPPDLSAAEEHTAQMLGNATSTGDLTTITAILSQWPVQPQKKTTTLEPVDVTIGPKPAGMPYDEDLWPFTLVLHEAIENDRPQIVSYVLSRGLKPQPFATLKALDTGSVEIFQALFDHGWDIDAPLAPNMSPPLCYAIANESLVQWFLSHGASPNASAPQNARSPLSSACANAPLHVVKLFYTYGASHFDALQTAAESPADGRLEVLRFLLDDGADINAVKWAHHKEASQTYALFGLGTALHYAAKGGYVDRVELLLSRGADVNVLDSNSRTPLEVAREHGQADTVALLSHHSIP